MTTTQHTLKRQAFVLSACLLALAAASSVRLPAILRAAEPPFSDASGSAAVADGSTPPMGRYLPVDQTEYADHPTFYLSGGGISPVRDLPLGRSLQGSWTTTVSRSDEPTLSTATAFVSSERYDQFGRMAWTWRIEPYFTPDKWITCSGDTCSAPFDAKFYARFGSVSGTVKLANGMGIPFPLSVSAAPVLATPPDAAELFQERSTVTHRGGDYTFTKSVLTHHDDYNQWTVASCTLYYNCLPIPVDPSNNWGLPLLGDGGVLGKGHVIRSNSSGSLVWRVSVAGKSQDVTVRSSQASRADFTMTLEEYIQALENELEKRLEEEEEKGPEDEEDEECEAPSSVAHPVDLINGNVFLDQVDVVLPGLRHDTVFKRRYNSLRRLSGALGVGWTHSFEDRVEVLTPQILRLYQPNGSWRLYLDPENNGRFAPYRKQQPRSTFTRTAGGFVRNFRSGGAYEYRADGRLVKRTDRTGRSTILTYDDDRLVEIHTPESRSLKLVYTPGGSLRRIVGPEGVIAEYSYLGAGLLGTVRHADGTGYRFTYNDSSSQLVTVSDLAGVVLDRHGYDGERAAWSELDGGQERHSYVYEPGRTIVTNARGGVSTFEWTRKNAGKFITKITGCGFCGAQSGVQVWERDDDGRVTKYIDAENNLTTFTWDGPNLASVTNALNRRTDYSDHDEFGRPRTIVKEGWGMAEITYAAEGVRTARRPGGQQTVYTYRNNRLETVRTAGGLTYSYEFNDLGELKSFTDARGKQTTCTYDAMGRRITITAPDGITTRIVRDSAGRVREVYQGDRRIATFEYNASGRLRSATDAASRTTAHSYDRYGRPDGVLDPAGGSTRVDYNATSDIAAITDANRQKTTFEYDLLGRMTKRIDPMSGEERYEYYLDGRLKTRTDRKNVMTTYVYDAIGRIRSATYSDGTPELSLTYDDLARTITLANGSDTLLLTFDTSGRLLSEHSALNGSIVSYTYNDDDQLETVSLNGSLVTQYVWVDGLLDKITSTAGNFGFSYDDLSRRTSLRYPNGVVTTYAYDSERRWLREIHAVAGSSVVAHTGYTHDQVGNRLSKATPLAVEQYTYDVLDRLAAVTRSGKRESHFAFRYDGVGNRTSDQIDGLTRNFSHDARNRLLTFGAAGRLGVSGRTSEPATVTVNGRPARMSPGNAFEVEVPVTANESLLTIDAQDASRNSRTRVYRVSTGAGQAAYVYDANGNVTERHQGGHVWQYEWNALDQLVRVRRDGDEVAHFAYDPLGRRVEKVVDRRPIRYVYAGADILSETRSTHSGQETYTYVHGPGIDEPLAARAPSDNKVYYHADGLGSIVSITNGAGSVVATQSYDAWGNIEAGSMESGPAFTGREWDPETGLYYYRARYYDPKLGRFLSEDPIGFAAGVNFYAYVLNNPLSWRDPLGLDAELNLFSPSDKKFYQAAQDSISPRGTFTVGAHGNLHGVYDLRGIQAGATQAEIDAALANAFLSPTKLAELIKQSKQWRNIKRVNLLSCDTGSADFAQELANLLGVDVWAPTTKALWDKEWAMSPDWPPGQTWAVQAPGKLQRFSPSGQ